MRGDGAVFDYFAAAETLEAGGELVGSGQMMKIAINVEKQVVKIMICVEMSV